MRTLIQLFCISVVTTSAFGAAGSLRSCSQPTTGVLPDNLPWLPNRANRNACNQMIISSALNVDSAASNSNKIAAFEDNKLAGISDTTLRHSIPILFDTSAWAESDSTVPFGELWWGRKGNWHVFVGQESYWRLTQGPAIPTQDEMAQRATELKRQLDAFKKKQPPPAPLTLPDKSGLFTQLRREYAQVGSTMATFEGGPKQIALGKISDARLKLEPLPILRGVMSFNLEIDGTNRSFTFPVMRNVRKTDRNPHADTEQKHRIRAAVVEKGEYFRCNEHPQAVEGDASNACIFGDGGNRGTYAVYGAFFGDHAALVAIHFRLNVNIITYTDRKTVASGIIILGDK